MAFRTEVNIPPSDHRISYRSGILFTGSCFTENIGSRMLDLQFPVDVNPFGICYNPSSVSRSLWALFDKREYKKSDLHNLNDQWFSFDHHSYFSHPDRDVCLDQINTRITASNARLQNTGTLILTWGTAWVYVNRDTANIVSNCHKVPAEKFQRYLLTVSQITDTYNNLFTRIRRDIPGLRVILTISPVRHWRDGARMNAVSKSTLVLAAHQLSESLSYCEYFPSYEIAMDDLRDYRFYAEDMNHPNSQMIDYIWGKFSGAYFDDETRQISVEIQKLVSAKNHRPFQPSSKQYTDFCHKQLQSVENLREKYPFLSLDELETHFRLKKS